MFGAGNLFSQQACAGQQGWGFKDLFYTVTKWNHQSVVRKLQQHALSWATALNLCFFYPYSAQFCACCLQFFESPSWRNAPSSSKAHTNYFPFYFFPSYLYRKGLSTPLLGWGEHLNERLAHGSSILQKLLLCSLKNATELMKNNLLT